MRKGSAVRDVWRVVPGASGAASAATAVAGWLSGRPVGRDVWQRPGRMHIETHGVHGAGGARVSRRVERALQRHPAVHWARVNAPACRVVIGLTDPPPPRRELVDLVAQAESAPATEEDEIAEEELHHPAEGATRSGALPRLVTDGAALAASGVTRVLPWTPLPPEVSSLVSALQLHPRLREKAAERLHGQERAASVLSLSNGVAQALAARSFGVVLDIGHRLNQWHEATADRQAWQDAEPRLIRGPDDAAAAPVTVHRPRPLPDGPVERYQKRALATAAATLPLAAPLVGMRRALALGSAALPHSTEAGRAAFATQLGAVLARHGGLVMDRAALRRLDRMDTLLIDEALLTSGEWLLTDVVPLAGADPAEVAERGFDLFAPDDATALRRGDGWTLGPAEELDLRGRSGVRERRRLRDNGAELVLGLARGQRLEALFAATAQPAPGLEAVVRAARRAKLRIVLAAADPDLPRNGIADAVVPLAGGDERTTGRRGSGLATTVRQVQAEGGAVMVLTDDRRALGVSDCGLGVCRDGAPPPWGAHVLTGGDLSIAVLVIEAVAASRAVTRDDVMLAELSSGVGAVRALAAGGSRAGARSHGTVHGGAALAFAGGLWRARRLAPPESPDGVSRQPWHLMPANAALRRLGTAPSGLSQQEARRRWRPGQRLEPWGTSLSAAFLEELSNPLTPVLAGGAVLSAVAGSLVDAGLVTAVAGGSALAGAAQRVRTDRALADLLARSAVGATVRRDSDEQVVTAEQLVPGDIIVLGPGDVVPADCRLLEAHGLEVDESSLTGESLPVTKDPALAVAADIAERHSMVYEGTTLAAGRAEAVVVATGADTEAGRSMAAAREAAPASTGLQVHLGRLTRRSVPLALGSAAAVTGAGLLHGVPVRRSLGEAVSLAVASVPEGLPFLVNAAQLSAARRLAERGALVRDPRVIEALGRVDVLCFDKTGTLTEGSLSVREVHDGRGGQPARSPRGHFRGILAAALRASPDGSQPDHLTHQTDRAVVECARAARVGPGIGHRGWRTPRSLPFEPSRGFHATVGRTGRGDEVLSVKGASEVVLSRCRWHRMEGRDEALNDAGVRRLTEAAEALAGAGHRVLAVAERVLPGDAQTGGHRGADHGTDKGARRAPEHGAQGQAAADAPAEETVRDLVFLGFLVLADPVRPSAAPAMARLQDAGVQAVMITGDHPATAEAIAATVRPQDGPSRVVTGAELDEIDDADLPRWLAEVDVIARCSPAQKVRIIEAYRRAGKVVAMTGDGANDAPAIRLAEVGIALGRRGIPAAQAAADLVVSDDRLETIIAALIEGRAMWTSVRQALGILVGGNVGESAFAVLGAAVTGRSPLNARQLLLVNLLTDLAPALAIARRSPPGHEPADLLRAGPDQPPEAGLTHEVAARGVGTLAGATGAWVAARLTGRSRRASTVALAALVGAQLGQTVLTGGVDRDVWLAGAGSAAALTGAIQTPGLSQFFGCTPLGPVGWGIAASSATTASLLGAFLARTPIGAALPQLIDSALYGGSHEPGG